MEHQSILQPELKDILAGVNANKLEFNKINERLDKVGSAFLELRQHIHAPAPIQERRYFVRPHASDITDQIDTAHALCFAELKNVERSAQANRSTYAKVEHCCETINPVLSKFELCVKQLLAYNEYGDDILITRLSHKSGQWYESVAILKIDKVGSQSSNQQLGSSITYMRRYALLAILGIGQIDDPTDTDR